MRVGDITVVDAEGFCVLFVWQFCDVSKLAARFGEWEKEGILNWIATEGGEKE